MLGYTGLTSDMDIWRVSPFRLGTKVVGKRVKSPFETPETRSVCVIRLNSRTTLTGITNERCLFILADAQTPPPIPPPPLFVTTVLRCRGLKPPRSDLPKVQAEISGGNQTCFTCIHVWLRHLKAGGTELVS